MEGPDADRRDTATRPEDVDPETAARNERLVESLLAGEHRALARVITRIENQAPGHRDLVARLHPHTGEAAIVGITGSPGAGKSTLVDKLAEAYRRRGDTVGVVAVDPSSPYSGGSVLGDRIRMASTVGDMDVFFRSMSARGRLGGLATATTDAVKALDAFGKDVVVVETVGAGQSEVDIVRTADTVAVLVQPGSGDDVQMLKAGILEIGDVFVVNKADMDGVERTVAELKEMIHRRDAAGDATERRPPSEVGHHGVAGSAGADADAGAADGHADTATDERADTAADATNDASDDATDGVWEPRVVETVATTGDGIDELIDAFDAHADHLCDSGKRETKARARYADEIRRLMRSDANELLDEELRRHGGVDALAKRVYERETDPYAVAASIVGPLRDCVEARRERDEPRTSE
ncbi:methylmalonyl Co-A mutase-associated GTPase MeaB [Halobellus sp. H-GB7]|uniref:methylmalonyl Co-A mutase-associated GTPase MeaB n=1 Tax=Halobellus sp. H-GB7 TaxID=3069756 RepID=UPI0027AF6246|nr:methylmalonyl Co-A mutase-associated GTPase MeaB [Halobellus sp. H-GB7]MDQ2053365.1 methylmalonyl Co-A mutase-associated GTPase MeaB [Halobellus sp. H-GB7]